MKRLIIALGLCALMGAASAAVAQGATWPAHCKNMRCVNKHLNSLNKRSKAQAAILQQLLDTNPPTNNALQVEIDALKQTDQSQDGSLSDVQTQLNQIWGSPALNGCWSQLAVSRFDSSGTVFTQGWPYNDYANAGPSGYPDASALDLAHADQPRNGFIYRLIFNSCTSG